MDNERKSLILTIAVGVLVLALIIGLVFYLVRFIQSRRVSSTQPSSPEINQVTPSPGSSGSSVTPPAGSTSDSGVSSGNNLRDIKIFSGQGFQVRYPKGWGVLTCNNSQNFELDPLNSQDQLGVNCDVAVKSVTVLVNPGKICQGENVVLGNVKVVRSKKSDGGYTRYEWCTNTNPVLNFTHRVSTAGEPATSKNDYSIQVEQIIKSISVAAGS